MQEGGREGSTQSLPTQPPWRTTKLDSHARKQKKARLAFFSGCAGAPTQSGALLSEKRMRAATHPRTAHACTAAYV